MKKILLMMMIVSISFVAAFPLQLLPNGTMIDLGTNETIDGTSVDFVLFNDTLYLIPKVEVVYNVTNVNYQNITNVTNVTYQNATYTGNFTNYTTQEITIENHTNLFNGTGELVYTTTEIDGILGTYVLGAAMSGYVSKGELTPYALKTELNTDTGSHIGKGTFWTMIILLVLAVGGSIAWLFNRE